MRAFLVVGRNYYKSYTVYSNTRNLLLRTLLLAFSLSSSLRSSSVESCSNLNGPRCKISNKLQLNNEELHLLFNNTTTLTSLLLPLPTLTSHAPLPHNNYPLFSNFRVVSFGFSLLFFPFPLFYCLVMLYSTSFPLSPPIPSRIFSLSSLCFSFSSTLLQLGPSFPIFSRVFSLVFYMLLIPSSLSALHSY